MMKLGEDFLKVFLNDYEWIIPIILAFSLCVWFVSGKQTKSEKAFALKRIAWTSFAFVFSLTIVMLILHLFVYPDYKFSPDKSGILVLQIEGDDENNSLQLHLVSTLNEELEKDSIEVRSCNEYITEGFGLPDAHDKAREIGKSYNALLTIWGNRVDSDIFHPRLTVVEDSTITIIKKRHTLKVQNINDMELSPEFVNKPICLIKFLKGFKYYQKSNYLKAIINFKEALRLQDSSIIDLGVISIYIGNSYLYLAETENVNEYLQKAINYYSNSIKVNQNYSRAFNNRGVAYIRMDLSDKAIFDFNKAIDINPNVALQFNNRGVAHTNKGLYDKSISDHNKAIELDSNEADFYDGRGVAYLNKNMYDYAISDFTRAIDINSRHFRAYNNRGVAYNRIDSCDKAINDLNKAIELSPNIVYHYYNRGLAYTKKGLYDLAISDHNRAIEIDSTDADAHNDRGVAYYKKNMYDPAISDFTKAIEINPSLYRAYNNRGLTYTNKGEYDKAINDYNKAIELNREYSAAYYNSALLFEKIGRINDAIKAFKFYLQFASTKDGNDIKYSKQRIRKLEKLK